MQYYIFFIIFDMELYQLKIVKSENIKQNEFLLAIQLL